MEFKLVDLEYWYDEFEPYIDKETMKIHHSKHHQTYVDKLNNSIKWTDAEWKSLEEIFENMSDFSDAVRNNWGWVYNHNIYWSSISPNWWWEPKWKLFEDIVNTFGSFDLFKSEMENAWLSQFGSGWAWLIVDKDWNLKITKTQNQDNPLMNILSSDNRWKPLFCIDVREHAYYLKYNNRRNDYLSNIWNIINWDKISDDYNN